LTTESVTSTRRAQRKTGHKLVFRAQGRILDLCRACTPPHDGALLLATLVRPNYNGCASDGDVGPT